MSDTQLTDSQQTFSDNDDNLPRRSHTRSTAAQIEDVFFENFLKFFQTAEERRRWDLERDIPWDKTNPAASDLTADIVQSFGAVEMFLPDYTSKIMELIRRSRGRAWFQANWGYEESKHSMVLEEWLIRSGKRTEDQLRDFERTLLGAEWDPDFQHPRQIIIYTMIQELATGLNYTNLRRRAEEEGDAALVRLLKWISADEMAHYNFFRKGVKAFLELEPDETIADLKYVFDNFQMPAHYQIPDWEERGRQIEAAGIYGPRIYLQKVRLPILEDLGISRQQLKNAGVPSHIADPMADRREQRAQDERAALRHATHSLPPGPASPPPPPDRRVVLED